MGALLCLLAQIVSAKQYLVTTVHDTVPDPDWTPVTGGGFFHDTLGYREEEPERVNGIFEDAVWSLIPADKATDETTRIWFNTIAAKEFSLVYDMNPNHCVAKAPSLVNDPPKDGIELVYTEPELIIYE